MLPVVREYLEAPPAVTVAGESAKLLCVMDALARENLYLKAAEDLGVLRHNGGAHCWPWEVEEALTALRKARLGSRWPREDVPKTVGNPTRGGKRREARALPE